jgi:hypothetical protein
MNDRCKIWKTPLDKKVFGFPSAPPATSGRRENRALEYPLKPPSRGCRMKYVFVLTASLWAVCALADELPSNLLMKCEGKLTVLPAASLPETSNFETMLRPKDGELADTDSHDLTTKGCELRNGIVRCEAKSVESSTMSNGSARRELKSYINRETGEYDLFLEMWLFDGRNATGKQIGNVKLHRKGICRPIGKPIF